MGAAEDLVVDALVVLDVALKQSPRELVLVAEMIEEPALGDAGFGDQLVDRRRADTAEGVASVINTFSGLPQPVKNVTKTPLVAGRLDLEHDAALVAQPPRDARDHELRDLGDLRASRSWPPPARR